MTLSERIQHDNVRSPWWVDESNRRLHVAIADKIREKPSLIGIAVENLRYWKRLQDAGLQAARRRWKLIVLTWTLEDILAYLGDPSEEAAVLRRTSPFCGVLSEGEERRALAAS